MSDYNLTEDGSAVGAHSLPNSNPLFVNAADDRKRIETNVNWLLDARQPEGWTYTQARVRVGGAPDNSNTQYALLALHEAIQRGVAVDAKVLAAVRARGLRVVNVDCTVVAERPKIAPHRDEIRGRLAAALELEPQLVNVKASTGEGIGFVGRGEGVAAIAVATLAQEA